MWYYSIDSQQQGPIDEATFDQLIAAGTITPGTFVWRDGMADWALLAQARASKNTPAPVNIASDTCSVCGKAVGADNLIELIGNRVCANCKPGVLQSMREGASLQAKNGTAWRDGKKIVAYDQTALPARCFKCNQPVTASPLTRKLTWHSPLYYLLIFINLFVYIIVAVFVRKRATLDIYLCDQHIKRRRYFLIGAWSGAALGFLLIIVAIAMNTGWLIAVGILLFFASCIAGIVGAQLLRTLKIKGNTIWISGSGKEFLNSLSPWP